jgi:hypothetical protein
MMEALMLFSCTDPQFLQMSSKEGVNMVQPSRTMGLDLGPIMLHFPASTTSGQVQLCCKK